MKRCEPVWTGLRSYVVVAFSFAKDLKSVWTGFNRTIVLGSVFIFWAKRQESVWTDLSPLCFYALVTFSWAKVLNRSEPVWTGLRYFFSKIPETDWTGLNRLAFLRCCGIIVCSSPWIGLNRFEPVYGFGFLFYFWGKKPWIGVKRFEPVNVFTLLWHLRVLKSLNRSEPVWTGLWFWVPFKFF